MNRTRTFLYRLAFSYFAETFFKVNSDKRKAVFKKFTDYFTILLGFAAGAGLSALLVSHIGSYTLLVTTLGLIGIYIIGRVLKKNHPAQPVDSN